MPTLAQTSTIMTQIAADVATAWDEVQVIYKGHPLLPVEATEYAVISLGDITEEWQGVQYREQQMTFTIVGQFQRPSDYTTNILDAKITKANALIDLLEPTNAHYASVTDHYFVTRILLHEDMNEIHEDVYRVGVEFYCTVSAQFGS